MSLFEFIRFATKAGVMLQDPAAVDWAVWFHDVVYDPRSDTNEADSAQLAGEQLTAAGLPAATVEKVQLCFFWDGGAKGGVACVHARQQCVRPRRQQRQHQKQDTRGVEAGQYMLLQPQPSQHPEQLAQQVEGLCSLEWCAAAAAGTAAATSP